MRSSPVKGPVRPRLAYAAVIAIAIGGSLAAQQIIPGSNVNMVSGTRFPTGDPFLQRQNEPSLAVSTRNPLHLLAGANDYRTVDLPGPFEPLRGEKMNADAWLGLYKSFDGGRTWQSTLLPGFPQDASQAGMASPIKGRQAGTDPVVKAGTNGLFYYAGLAFDRGQNAPSTVFVARFVDHNNRENGDPIEYLGTRVVDADTGTRFLDKTALAVDVPRGAATCTITTQLDDRTTTTQTIPAGNVYVAYAAFTGTDASQQSQILFSRSSDCGNTWSAPKNLSIGNILNQNAQIAINPTNGHIWVSWRRFQSGTLQSDGIFIVRSTDGGATFSRPVRVAPVSPFDQGTSTTSFRTNAFQTMAIDDTGRIYVAWPERGQAVLRPDRVTGDSRIVVSTSTTGSSWTTPKAIETQGLGHQLMPTLTFHGGKLRLIYYDLREDVSQLFQQFIDELPILTSQDNPRPPRHTVDVYIAQAAPGATPAFTSVRLSDYAFGTVAGSSEIQRLQYNPPNLPLFREGTVPFMGDYIDLAAAPAFVQGTDGVWRFNTAPTNAAVSHGVWTDNRDVRPPIDGHWENYTPVMSESLGTTSLFDPTKTVPPCFVGQTGMRNQNIYTAKITEGLFVASPGNTKPLGAFQRAFVVLVENARAEARSYRLQIANQPPGGQASFQQFAAAGSPLDVIDATVPPFSTIARSVYVTSSEAFAQVRVTVNEIAAPGAPGPLAGGLSSSVVLNGDPTNPSIQNPSIQNPSIQNPDIQVAEAYNPAITTAFLAPSIQNPSIQNPSIQNPSIQNPSIQNPELSNDAIANPSIIDPSIQNPSIQNPSIQNPSIQNPSIQNQDLVNGAIQDTSWVITNDGNTAASYAIKLLTNGTLPTGFKSQLVLHKTYKTPAAQDCTLADQPHTVLIANIPDPAFLQVTDPSIQNPSIQNPSIQNATIGLAPGESANVTLRIVDPNRFDGVEFDAGASIAPAAVAQSVNTEDVAQGLTTPRVAIPMTITTAALTSGSPGGVYSASLATFASTGGTSWTVTEGSLPPGVNLDSTTGQLSGTPTSPGNYVFTVRATDTTGNVDVQTLAIKIDPVVPGGFSRVWNGADNNWNNPKNWSPAGVPTAVDDVYISAAIAVVPTLTSNVTIRNLVVESGAEIDTNGFTLTVTGNADAGNTIIGTGSVVMSGIAVTARGTFPNITISGAVLLAGPLTATANLTLLPGASIDLNGFPITVGGQLVTNTGGGIAPRIVGELGLASMTVGGVDVDGLTLSRVSLTINGGALTQFDNVRFLDYQPQDEHLTLNHAGAAAEFSMTGLTFFTVPTTGHYIQATDTTADGQALVINVSASLPGDGSSRSTTQGGAEVNWLFNPNDASIAVTQYVEPDVAIVGSPLTYTVLVRNGGPATATNVVLTNPLPAGATFVSATVPPPSVCGFSANTVTCNLGSIAPLQTIGITIVLTPTAAGSLNNAVTVTAAESDPGTSDNAQTVSTPVFAATAAADLSITQTDSADPVTQSSSFSYSLVVSNAGPGTATSVLVLDNLPSGVTATTASSTRGICGVSGARVTCQIASLAPGEQATITIDATVSGFGIVTNTAVVFSPVADPDEANNGASETTVIGTVEGCVAATFRGPFTYDALPGPATQVHLADMDADGDLDLVTSLQAPANGVSVLLNNGEGTYGAPIFSFLSAPAFVGTIANFNGDEYLDMVVGVGGTPNTLRVLLGNGDGTLAQSGSPIPVSSGFFVDSLDADGDGDKDLITRASSGDLVLLKNNGAAVFDPPVPIYSGPVGLRAAIGDYNEDGKADIVIARTDANVTLLLGNGTGGFTASGDFATASAPRGVVALGDLNGDGHLDIGISEGNSISGTSRLTLRFGTGAGSFGAEVDVSPGNTANFTVAADVNGDGNLDLVTNHAVRTAVSVQLGNGAGAFSAPGYFATTAFSNPAVGDVDGDGKPDIASGDEDGTLGILLNNCGRPATDLGVTVSESADPVNENDELVYTLTVTNTSGNAASNVSVGTSIVTAINSTLPPNATVTSTTTGVGGSLISAPDDGLYFWLFPAVEANSSFTIEFRVRAQGGGTVRLTSTVTSDEADTDATNNTAFETTTINATGVDLVVTNTDDSGPGSLRQAILDSNSDSGDVDRIVFQIAGTGPHTIVPLTALPTISQPVTIDGTTQTGFAGTPVIELNGNGLVANGLNITGGGTTVRGLVINRFNANPGIRIQTAGGNVIAGNFIGTDVTGTLARPNLGGITIVSSGNAIGGLAAGDRNVVSGNTGAAIQLNGATASNNVIAGNYIGTDVTGAFALPNTNTNVEVLGGSNNVIGGTTAAHRNVISASGVSGVAVRSGGSNNRLEGNYIGLNAAGTAALGNGTTGVFIGESPNNIIGGTAPGAGNVISGNFGQGVGISFVSATGNLVQGNFIGTNAAGTAAIPNAQTGVAISQGATNTIVGGTTAASRNVISGNALGVSVNGSGTTGTVIAGNYIGIDVTGTAALGNLLEGVAIFGSPTTLVGGTVAAARNVISGNATIGVRLNGASVTGTIVQGNYIGTNAAGSAAIPNANRGVTLESGASGNTIGGASAAARNVIAGNASDGVLINGTTTTGNVVQGNYIGTNAAGTAAVANQFHGVSITDAPDNIIGGTAAGEGNLIAGNAGHGIGIFNAAASGNVIRGNLIGLNADGSASIPNGIDGIALVNAVNTIVGGASAAARNIVSGNARIGVGIFEAAATGNVVVGNFIGTDPTGTTPFGNASYGVFVGNSSPSTNFIGGTAAGEGNTVAFNAAAGVYISAGAGNAVRGNAIFSNAGLGIDLDTAGVTPNDAGDGDTGANNIQNFPVLTSASTAGGTTTVQGTLNSTASTTFRIELFSNAACDASGNGEGQTFVGTINVTTDGSGNATFTTEVPASTILTATATDPNGNTSEFSQCRTGGASLVLNVGNTNDTGPGSLRQAILDSNASTGVVNTISFNIGGGGIQRISPQSPLPEITDPVIIDGTTQPGYTNTPLIELDGSGAGPDATGLQISAGSTTVKGLAILDFGNGGSAADTGIGIALTGEGNNTISGNYIGLDAAGAAAGNRAAGIVILGSPSNVIGGTTAGTRNVISGNGLVGVYVNGATTTGNQILGNFIGISPSGSTAIPNGEAGVLIEDAAANTVGGTTPGAANVISGNVQVGVGILGPAATGNVVAGNFVGLSSTGTAALMNGDGVLISDGASANVIGGTTLGARNVISGNQFGGIVITTTGAPHSTGNLIQGNFIGLNAAGNAAIPNGLNGVEIFLSNFSGPGNNVVGGTAAGAGNVISGNGINGVIIHGPGNLVQGNLIGTNATGTGAVPNQVGVQIRAGANVSANGNTIGGAVDAARNVVSGNSQGVLIFSDGLDGGTAAPSGNVVQRNYIGLNATGTGALGNNLFGVGISTVNGGVIPTGNTIGGTSANGNVISGNTGTGVSIQGNANAVQGNTIGLRPDLAARIANGLNGIDINGSNNLIGGSTAGLGNIVTGNTGIGIRITATSTGNQILGNLIGANPTSEVASLTGNTAGGLVVLGSNTTIGGQLAVERNVIHRNGSHGVNIPGSGVGNAILFNSFHANAGLGINLGAAGVTANDAGDPDTGANTLQNFPVLTSAIRNAGSINVAGTLNSTANTIFRIQFFSVADLVGGAYCDASGNGEGQHFLGETNVTTNGSGNATINVALANNIGEVVTATATDPNGNTSEFSQCRALVTPQTFSVSNTNDSGAGSLRQAVLDANANVGALDTIAFNIAGTGVKTIAPVSLLPIITDPVIIDGTTQPGFASTPIIELDGTSAGAGTHGLQITSGGSTVRGLVINRFGGAGIVLSGGSANTITGNYIGTDVTGAIARANGGNGITVSNSNNTIGGTTVGARNVISGNLLDGIGIGGAFTSGNVIQGNFIGTDAAGSAALSNMNSGIGVGQTSGAVIGGLSAGAGNVISGNLTGIQLLSTSAGTLMQGNRIGTNADGTSAIPNGAGINVGASHGNTIGGTAAGAANLISGNTGNGIWINAADANVVQGNRIGTNASGTVAIPNGFGMFVLGANNAIGGTAAGAGNLISGNTNIGVSVAAGATATVILGNRIGTDVAGIGTVPNGSHGIFIDAPGTTVGGTLSSAANIIAFNGSGVRINSGVGNAVLRNSIHDNVGLGIDIGPGGTTANDAGDVDTGANNLQNFPVLSSAATGGGVTTIQGTLNSIAGTTFRVELFSNTACDGSGNGEGQTFVGTINVTTDGSGNASFTTEVPASSILTATATDPSGNTSEFSQCFTASGSFAVSNTNSTGPGSLRQAIIDANATSALDTITFNIAGSGIQTITLASLLPTITNPIVIDATTQPGYAGTPLIALNGNGLSGNGLVITGGSSTIRGLAIGGFSGFGIQLSAGGSNIVESNFIGIDPNGTLARANTVGIVVRSANNTIGGTSIAARNVISGNTGAGVQMDASGATGNVVRGNYIGVTSDGTAAAGNGSHGVFITAAAQNNVIGGTAAGAGNVISGNGPYGIALFGGATLNVIQGNLIGTNAAGTAAIANGLSGVGIVNANNNGIGGAIAAARNVLSGNASAGVFMADSNGNLVRGNYIGTDVTGTSPLPNNVGVIMDGTNNVVGGNSGAEGNVIAFNAGTGVWITAQGPNSVLGNSVHSNGALGIDLGGTIGLTLNDPEDADVGANSLQNFPVITSATAGDNSTTIAGTLSSSPNTIYRLEFFSNTACDGSGNGEGQTFLGTTSVTTDNGGLVNFSVSLGPAGNVTVTATDSSGNTSEFSPCATVTGQASLLVFPNRGLNALQVFDPASRTILRTIPIPAPYSYTAGGTMLATALVRPDGTIFTNVRNGSAAATAIKVSSTGEALAAQISGAEFLQQIAFDPADPNRETVIGGTPFLPEVRAVNPVAETSTTRITRTGANFIGMVAAANGDIYAGTFCGPDNGAVLRYDSAGTLIGVVAQVGIATGSCEINGLARDDSGNLFVAQNGSNRIAKFDVAGSFTGFITAPSFANPAQVFFNTQDDLLYVGNSADDRLTILTAQGALVAVVNMGGVGVGVPGAFDGANAPPVADAGPDQNVPVDSVVQLTGAGSSDPEDQVLTYTWILNTKPADSTAVLSATNIINPTFIADKPGTYIAQLVVNDGFVNSPSDTVTITTQNQAPIANAGADQSNVAIGATVNLDGSASIDPDGQSITYSWSFVSKPSTSAATIFNATTATPSFVADASGLYRLQLAVNDGQTSSVADTVDIVTVNQPPVANAGSDQNVLIGSTVQLNGGGSNDPDENPLTYAWTLPTRPAGSTATLVNATTAGPTFVPDAAGTYVARLVVNDGFVNSPPDDVAITATTNNISMALVGTPLIGVARQATLEVTLPSPAPAGGVIVTVTSDNTNIVTVGPPNTAAIAEGALTGQVTVNGVSEGTTTLQASAPGYTGGTFTVSVTTNVLTTPATLNVPFGQTASFPVNIPQAAPVGGIVVNLVSSNSAVIDVITPTVTIPQGALSANGTVQGVGIGTVSITASNPAFSTSTSQVSSTGGLNIVQTSVSYAPAFPATITIQLESGGIPVAAPPGGVAVTLTPANGACVSAQSPVTIPQGLTSITANLSYGGTASRPCATTVTGSAASLTTDSINVTVESDPGISVNSNGATIGAGLQNGFWSAGLGIANHGGVTVRIASSNPDVALVSPDATTPGTAFIDVPLANLSTNANYYLQGVEGATDTVTITASAPGFTDGTGSLTIVPAAIRLEGLPASTTSLSADGAFIVRIGTATVGNANLNQILPIRAGGSMTVTITNSNATVAQLTTLAGSAQTRTLTIGPNQSNSPTSVATGGIAFDPLAGGTTTVSASAGGSIISTTAASAQASVTQPGITVNSNNATIGAGLQNGFWTANLGGSNHGGVTLRIASSNPAVALVSKDASTPGTEFIDVPVPNLTTGANYYLQGVEGAADTVTITASAPGFTNGTGSLNIVPAAIRIEGVPATTSSLSADDAFFVRIGTASAGNANLNSILPVRAGGSVTVTITNSNATVARLTTLAGSAQSRTVTIGPNQSNSPTSVATDGIAFDPLASGTTTVSATAGSDIIATVAASAQVSVTGPGITVNSTGAVIGAGLQNGLWTATLGGSNHGGVTMRIASSNPAVALVSPNATTPGTAFIDVPVANLSTNANYYLQGVEGAADTVTITASAPGFADGTGSLTIVPAAIRVEGVPATTTSLSADDAFFIRIGTATAGNANLNQILPVRAGGSVTVTVTNSNPTVARLTTLAGSAQSRTVTIGPNQSNSPTSVATGGIAFDPLAGGATTVNATAGPDIIATAAASVQTTVTGPGISVNSNGTTIGAGLQNGLWTATLGGSNHGGVTMRIASSNPNVALVSPNATTPGTEFIDVPVANLNTSGNYYLQGVEGATGTVTITASAPGFTDGTGTLTIVPAAIRIEGVPASTTSLSADDAFFVRIGTPGAGNANLNQILPVRAGSSVTVTITNTNATVARLTTLAGSAQSRTVTIGPNQSNSPTSVAAGGIAFDPLANGTTTVSASAGGSIISTTAASAQVSVTAPGITINSTGAVIGAGLQNGSWTASLGGSNHGGVTMRIASSDPAVALVSPDATTPGTAFIDVPIANLSTSANYYLQGVEGAAGTVTITASAPQFANGTGSLTIVQAALRIESLPTSVDATGANAAFFIRVGLPNFNNTNLQAIQNIRAGSSASVSVSLTHNPANVLASQLVTQSGGAQTANVTIAATQGNSPTSVAGGGVAFDPLQAGASTVTASIPGFITTDAGTVTVQVTPSLLGATTPTKGKGKKGGG